MGIGNMMKYALLIAALTAVAFAHSTGDVVPEEFEEMPETQLADAKCGMPFVPRGCKGKKATCNKILNHYKTFYNTHHSEQKKKLAKAKDCQKKAKAYLRKDKIDYDKQKRVNTSKIAKYRAMLKTHKSASNQRILKSNIKIVTGRLQKNEANKARQAKNTGIAVSNQRVCAKNEKTHEAMLNMLKKIRNTGFYGKREGQHKG